MYVGEVYGICLRFERYSVRGSHDPHENLTKYVGVMIPSLTTFKDFGGNTNKPTWPYSNYDFIRDINGYTSSPGPMFGKHALVRKYVDKHGDSKFAGTRNLKGSQAYTPGLGRGVKKTILKNKGEIRAKKAEVIRVSRNSANRMVSGAWSDADLESVLAFLHE